MGRLSGRLRSLILAPLVALAIASSALGVGLVTQSGSRHHTAAQGGGGGGSSNFAERSTDAGVEFANALDSQSAIDTYYHAGGNGVVPTRDTTIKPTGAAASTRFVTEGDDGEGNVNMRFPIGPYVLGDVFWTYYQVRLDSKLATQAFLNSGGNHSDMKYSILSAFAASFQDWEVVAQNNQNAQMVSGYYQTGTDPQFVQWDTTVSMQPSGSDIMYQPELDNGSNPLTGTDPDDGSAWSTSEQQRGRYGFPYNLSTGAADFAQGIGDPIGGYFRARPGEWIGILQRVEILGWDSPVNKISVWAHYDGQPYVQLFNTSTARIGGPGPFDGLWLTNFCSDRVAGGRRVSTRETDVSGVTIHAVGPGTPTGDGTLSYSSSTGRLTWTANGQSAGTARGASATKRWLNLKGASGSNNHLSVEVDVAQLPATSQSDTITIASGRDDTFSNYAEVIVSRQDIKAPGGDSVFAESYLEAQANALAEGSSVQLTGMNGLNSALIADDGPGGTVIEYGQRGYYDPSRRQVWYIGHSHANDDGSGKELIYDLDTNQWSATASPDEGGYAHYNFHSAINRENGTRYFAVWPIRENSSYEVKRKVYGQSWASTTSIPVIDAMGALEWNLGANSGAGGLVFGNDFGIFTSNAAVTSWTERLTLNRGGWLHPFSVALHSRGEVYLGGGDSTTDSSLKWWVINASGTVSALPNLPKAMGGGDSASRAIPVPHPDDAHILAFGGTSSDKSVIRFDPAAQTWSSNLGNHPFGQNGAGDRLWYATLHELDVVLVFQTLGGGSPQVWIYKPHAVAGGGASLHQFDDAVRVASNEDTFKPLRRAVGY